MMLIHFLIVCFCFGAVATIPLAGNEPPSSLSEENSKAAAKAHELETNDKADQATNDNTEREDLATDGTDDLKAEEFFYPGYGAFWWGLRPMWAGWRRRYGWRDPSWGGWRRWYDWRYPSWGGNWGRWGTYNLQ